MIEEIRLTSKRRALKYLIVVTVAALLLIHLSLLPAVGQERIDFAHDILPVLQSRCAECHSNSVYKGGLSLETREMLVESGSVEPGKKSNSDLFARITSEDLDERMPPEGDALTKEQVKSIGDWIDQGVRWPEELTLKKKTFSRPLALREINLPKSSETVSHPIDRLVNAYWKSHSIAIPAPLAPPEFLRRSKLDLLGQLPTSEELTQLKMRMSNSQDAIMPLANREHLIDDLLSQKTEYANHWMSFWNDLLRNDYVGTGYIDGGRKQITGWLFKSLLDNKPYDQFVRELIDPTDESLGFIKGIKWRGRVNASQVEPLQFSQNVSQVFLGINMKCASCHDSFIDDWKLDDAYGLAAIAAEKPLEIHRCDVPTGRMAKSRFVFSDIGAIDQTLDRKQRLGQLAQLMTSEKNGRLARTIVNRIWHRMMGRGLVHPVDVMANEAWSESVLDYLAMDLVKNGYDLKKTIRLIATSQVYSARSMPNDPASSDAYVFCGVERKRLSAEQFVDAIWTLTGTAPIHMDAKVLTGIQGSPTAHWIWKDATMSAPAKEVVRFRRVFELAEKPAMAMSVTSCDNAFTMFVNGKKVSQGTEWTQPAVSDIRARLVKGRNVVLIRASNVGASPNPAALFSEILLRTKTGEESRIASNGNWDWTKQKTDNMGKSVGNDAGKESAAVEWKPAVRLGSPDVYAPAMPAIRSAIGNIQHRGEMKVRASLVQSNALMRSLGRPNREQVVTTRPAELSTLQALDLSNGKTLADWLEKGASNWADRQVENKWRDGDLLRNVFLFALSREPTTEEQGLFKFAELPESERLKRLEDLLWVVTMLPEFQFVN